MKSHKEKEGRTFFLICVLVLVGTIAFLANSLYEDSKPEIPYDIYLTLPDKN